AGPRAWTHGNDGIANHRSRATAEVRHVFWHGLLHSVSVPEPRRSKAWRLGPHQPAAECHSSLVLRSFRKSGEILREHSIRVRDRIASASIQTDYSACRAAPRKQ